MNTGLVQYAGFTSWDYVGGAFLLLFFFSVAVWVTEKLVEKIG